MLDLSVCIVCVIIAIFKPIGYNRHILRIKENLFFNFISEYLGNTNVHKSRKSPISQASD